MASSSGNATFHVSAPGPQPCQCDKGPRDSFEALLPCAFKQAQFEVAGISQTHDEMVRKIEEETAVNEARMDMALSNVDQQKIKIEEEAQKLQANELVKQFKIEMGWAAPSATGAAAEKTIGGKEPQKTGS